MLMYENHKVYMNGEYPAIFLNGKNQHVHRVQWVKYYGDIPAGFIVHHKDENKMNWNIENLELLSRAEHIKKHKDIVKRPGIKVKAIKNDTEIVFESIEKAAKYCGTYTSGIQNCFKGKQKHANGWFFERVV